MGGAGPGDDYKTYIKNENATAIPGSRLNWTTEETVEVAPEENIEAPPVKVPSRCGRKPVEKEAEEPAENGKTSPEQEEATVEAPPTKAPSRLGRKPAEEPAELEKSEEKPVEAKAPSRRGRKVTEKEEKQPAPVEHDEAKKKQKKLLFSPNPQDAERKQRKNLRLQNKSQKNQLQSNRNHVAVQESERKIGSILTRIFKKKLRKSWLERGESRN